VYAVEIGRSALEEIARLPPFHGRMILSAIEEQLSREPTVETRNRKQLPGIEPPFDAVPPIWELRVGVHRVFYDVNVEDRRVRVRAVRRKPAHKTTKDIL
jgi:mRNA-degrading endonuclease RelE of RelBE toxin-antitoxin system